MKCGFRAWFSLPRLVSSFRSPFSFTHLLVTTRELCLSDRPVQAVLIRLVLAQAAHVTGHLAVDARACAAQRGRSTSLVVSVAERIARVVRELAQPDAS